MQTKLLLMQYPTQGYSNYANAPVSKTSYPKPEFKLRLTQPNNRREPIALSKKRRIDLSANKVVKLSLSTPKPAKDKPPERLPNNV